MGDREREEWIRQSSQERQFLDWFVGKPHPAAAGGAGRYGPGRKAVVWVVVILFVVPLAISLVQYAVALFAGQ